MQILRGEIGTVHTDNYDPLNGKAGGGALRARHPVRHGQRRRSVRHSERRHPANAGFNEIPPLYHFNPAPKNPCSPFIPFRGLSITITRAH
jgi:hypothetical protein